MKTRSVRTELTSIQNWPELAAHAHYRVDGLAELLDVSHHALRVFFARAFKTTTKKWLRRQRIMECQRRMRGPEPLKNIAATLGYRDATHLTHDFKATCGISPREWIRQERLKEKQPQNLFVEPSPQHEQPRDVPRESTGTNV